MQKIVDGIYVDMNAEEITEREAEIAQAVIDRQARTDAATAEENNKTSGKTKLKDLGLTDEEISALMG
tara:strand:+ start:16 stop:219 length:204 start_codon:yes stop_codon:yes gene_type:complete